MDWWLWFLLGLALLGAEVLTPGGFVMLFFGIAALVVGALSAGGVSGSAWVQWLLFSFLSIVSLVVFRGPLLARIRVHPSGGREVDSLVGGTAVLLEDLAAGGVGKAELRGTAWTVRALDGSPLPKGRRCRVERIEGLTLWVRAE
jgi:hypothetical protein